MKVPVTKTILASALLMMAIQASGANEDPAFRDPFWPVGYSPAKEEPVPVQKQVEVKPAEPRPQKVEVSKEPQPDWPAALRCLKISGYAESNDKRSCVVNGKTVSENEKISIVYNGFRYTWKIDTIAPQKSGMRFSRVSVSHIAK